MDLGDKDEYIYVYMVQMNDFTEMKNLIQYYRPMVTDIWADVLYERQTQFFAKNSIVMPIYCCIIVYLNIEWIVHFFVFRIL